MPDLYKKCTVLDMDEVFKNNKAVKMFEEVRNLGNGK